MSTYSYRILRNPSQEIRLVTLLPGEFQTNIRIQIHHAILLGSTDPSENTTNTESLSEAQLFLTPPWIAYKTIEGRIVYFNDDTHFSTWLHPNPAYNNRETGGTRNSQTSPIQFEALSYTWGSSTSTETIFVEDEGGDASLSSKLDIQPNLAEALRYLRYASDRPRTLWIDAICINQRDDNERTEQVKRMNDVYSLASRVVAWLGVADGATGKAFSALRYIGAQVEYSRNNYVIPSPESKEKDWYLLESQLPYDNDTFASIHSVLARPWFERVWIVQEIQLAGPHSILQCGNEVIPWPFFRRAVLCMQSKKTIINAELRSKLMEVRNLADYAVHLNLTRLTRRHRERKCSDPRDKIYGILSTTTPAVRSRIFPQYSKAVQDVYKDAFLSHYDITQRLELFNDCCWKEGDQSWPSWVPDWYAPADPGQPFRLMFTAGISPAEAKFIEPNTLRATGVQCAVVSSVGLEPQSDDIQDIFDATKVWFSQTANTDTYPTGETGTDAFVTVLCGYRTRERYPKIVSYPTLQEWSDTIRRMLLQTPDRDELTGNRELYDALGFAKGKKFVGLTEGYFGLAPKGTKTGDVICVLLGTNVPLVLRPSPGGTFRLIGECCIHGLHDGISLLGMLPAGWRVRTLFDANGLAKYSYYDGGSDVDSEEDPRLPALSRRYQRADFVRTADDPIVATRYYDTQTESHINYDPRMLPEALRARGANLRDFDII
ncbi:putative heterokaryon incompatibility [Rosellinia necatrix]|uniref:Putative heterokaryon incompatibility n=1 Tax=Rosellinia necatrix TaxID=77044 RepID=A0A1W2TCI3_ROSNE|nr:putative heterokaryon incompatibility [Rosellinia necatrix]